MQCCLPGLLGDVSSGEVRGLASLTKAFRSQSGRSAVSAHAVTAASIVWCNRPLFSIECISFLVFHMVSAILSAIF